jgi:hypothetical protein
MSEPENINFGSVKIHHKKSGFFRVVHADGAWGGVNGTAVIHMTFYSEHPAIPTSVIYPLDKNGLMVNTPTIEGDEGLHREMEVAIALTLPAAMQVRTTLDNFIRIAVEQMNDLNQKVGNAHKPSEVK